jgi:hypothetical protein
MLNNLIEFLQLKVAGVSYMDKVYGLAEHVSKNEKKAPFIYCSKGEYKEILIDKNKATTYFRKAGNVGLTTEIIDSGVACRSYYNISVPLVLNVFIEKKHLPIDDEFTDDRVASDLIKAITTKTGDLRKLLKAKKVNVSVSSYSNNNEDILRREYVNYDLNEINFKWVVLSLNISVSVIIDTLCFNEICDIDTDILHVFNFCNESTFARLTDEQKACLCDKLDCGGGGEVEIRNSENTLIATVEAPATYILPDENYEVYVDSVLVDSGSFPVYGNQIITINL